MSDPPPDAHFNHVGDAVGLAAKSCVGANMERYNLLLKLFNPGDHASHEVDKAQAELLAIKRDTVNGDKFLRYFLCLPVGKVLLQNTKDFMTQIRGNHVVMDYIKGLSKKVESRSSAASKTGVALEEASYNMAGVCDDLEQHLQKNDS